MPTRAAKLQVMESLKRLPDDASFDDILYHVYVLHGIAAGMADVEAGRVIPHEEVKNRIFEWLHDDPHDHLVWRTAEKLYALSLQQLAQVDALINEMNNHIDSDMPNEIDFSQGERGKFYAAGAEFRLAVHLDKHVEQYLASRAEANGVELSALVNELLKRDIAMLEENK